jgi:chromosome partitioning protein
LALHLACAAKASGFASAIIDLDPQASAAAWHDSRADEEPVVVPLPYTRLAQGLDTARAGGADLVLIDTAPHSETAALAAARAADLVLIPCRLSILDLRAIAGTAEIVRIAQKPAFVVLNAYHPRAVEILEDARAAVAVHGLSLAPAGLAARERGVCVKFCKSVQDAGRVIFYSGNICFLCVGAFFWGAHGPPSKANKKPAPRLIHNRPGPVRCSECLVQVRYVAAAYRPGKRRLWVSRELNPIGCSAHRLSFWFQR